MSSGNYIFAIVNSASTPLYMAEFLSPLRKGIVACMLCITTGSAVLYGVGEEKVSTTTTMMLYQSHISDCVLHAALDAVDESVWSTTGMYVYINIM